MSSSTILYVADPKADVVLRSSDGIDFLVQRVVLQVNSEVFDGMFASSSGEVGEKDEKTGFPVVKLDEKGEDLDFLLRFIVRGQVKTDLLTMPLKTAVSLLSIAEKFEIETAKDGAVSRLASLAPSDPVGVLGPALAFHQTSLSRMALSALGNDYEWREERVPDGAYSWRYFNLPSGNPHLVSDIPLEWLERISSASWIQLVRMEEQVLTGCSTWENLASSFKAE